MKVLNVNSKIEFKNDYKKTSSLVAPKQQAISDNVASQNLSSNNLKAKFLSFKGFGESNISFDVVKDTGVTFKDVGGIDEIIDKAQDLVDNIKDPKKYRDAGIPAPKGILLYGPPGTGKTLMAKALASEAGVPFLAVSAADFETGLAGGGANNVGKLFKSAKQSAKQAAKDNVNSSYGPPEYQVKPKKTPSVIIFIDEFDAIAKKRGGINDGRDTINKLISEMDGISKDKGVNVVVLAATNDIDAIDEAAKRPGRFDEVLEVPNPSHNPIARKAILEIHSRDKKFKNEEEKAQILEKAAIMTKEMSGAQLRNILIKAAKYTVKRDEPKHITWDDIAEARLEELAGPVKKMDQPNWVVEDTVAHECAHALVGQIFYDITEDPSALPRKNSFITLEPRGKFLGAVFTEQGDNPTLTFDSVISNSARALASINIEKMRHNGTNTAGVSQDLKSATGLITDAVTKYGLGPNTGSIEVADNKFARKAVEEPVSKDILIMRDAALKCAKLIVDFHKDFIDEYVEDFKTNRGKGGKLMSGEEFANRLNQWHEKTGKAQKLPKLKKEIAKTIEIAKNNKDFL